MRVDELMKMQKELDDFIIETKDLGDKSNNEMLNMLFCAMFSEIKEVRDEYANGTAIKKDVLGELIDVLHFLLAIGYRVGLKDLLYVDIDRLDISERNVDTQDITMLSIRLMDRIKAYKFWSGKPSDSTYLISMSWMELFTQLWAMMLSVGGNNVNIVSAYTRKWNINKTRQREGY